MKRTMMKSHAERMKKKKTKKKKKEKTKSKSKSKKSKKTWEENEEGAYVEATKAL